MTAAQSLLVVQEMIEVSRHKFRKDGILFIVWGWIMFTNHFFLNFLSRAIDTNLQLMSIVRALRIILPLAGILFSVYYIVQNRKKVQTFIGISLRYVWVSLFFCMVLVNLIQFNVLHSINFELQHPIFMALISFATIVTGGILRYKLIFWGGIAFGILAYIASNYELHVQLLIESIAWVIAFVIPGHILYAGRKKNINV